MYIYKHIYVCEHTHIYKFIIYIYNKTYIYKLIRDTQLWENNFPKYFSQPHFQLSIALFNAPGYLLYFFHHPL